MQIGKQYKLEKAVSKDKFNEALQQLCLDGKSVVATDGHIMAIIPIQRDDGDVDGVFPVEAVTVARKIGMKYMDAQIKLNGEARLEDGRSFPREKLTYPNWKSVIPENDGFSFGIDAENLYRLSQAMGTSKLQLTFSSDGDRAIFVYPLNEDMENSARGIIMPVRISNDKPPKEENNEAF